AEAVKRQPVTTERDPIEFAPHRLELVLDRLTGRVKQLSDVLVPGVLEAVLRLSAGPVPSMDPAAAGARVHQVVAPEDADRVTLQSQQHGPDDVPSMEQPGERRTVPA